MILVITSKRDAHIECVAQHLETAGHPWIRLNTEDLPRNAELTIQPDCAAGRLLFRDSGLTCSLEEISAVWYRKPDRLDLAHFGLDDGSLDYVEAEFNEVLHGLYALLHDKPWINHPLTTRLAHRKLLQLRVATACGFRVPRGLVTNRPEEALAFAASVDWNVAIKSLGAISVTTTTSDEGTAIQHGMFTRRVGREELLAHADKITHMPTLFQEFVEKRSELRITCVGDEMFACRIGFDAETLAAEDYRFATKELPHSRVDCPAALRAPIQRYMRKFDLNFGCFDIAETSEGDHVFFECNPNGQWLWVEEKVGHPISRAIAGLMMASPLPALSR